MLRSWVLPLSTEISDLTTVDRPDPTRPCCPFSTRDNKVVVIDTKTDTVVQVIPVEGMPNGVYFC